MPHDWQPISTAPPGDTDLQLGIIEKGEAHSLVFACRRHNGRWINARTREPVDIHPTHWRKWQDNWED